MRVNGEYWTDINDTNLRPAGWFSYMKKKQDKNEFYSQIEDKNIKFYSFKSIII